MIEINNMTKQYGDNIILKKANYTFPKSGIVCLLGASGEGKTTLLNILAGFDSDYEGEIFVGYTPINKMNSEELCNYRKNNIGFVFQNYNLLSGYTVLENVIIASELTGEAYEYSCEKGRELLLRLGINEKENQKVENLSGGQKQRVAIARALMNEPKILFADEPTGALDRKTSTEIMELLKEVAKDRLVVVITHDTKISDFADEIIYIKNKKIVSEESNLSIDKTDIQLKPNNLAKVSAFSKSFKNFKIHLKRYIALSFIISIGILAFLFSLSFGNVMEQSIETFKEKNTAYNNGYIIGADDGTIFEYLNSDKRIENVYYQYKLNEVGLSTKDKTVQILEKYPTPKTEDGISYGTLPRKGMGEIALTPSLAKKFDSNIDTLLGNELILNFENLKYTLTVSGIYNASYDDFLVSSDIEQQLYENLPKQKNYSINYDVVDFSSIVAVSNNLKLRGLDSKNASREVYELQKTFNSLSKMFFVISILILGISLFISSVILFKLQNTRYNEMGLLSALGFNYRQITSIILYENIFLSIIATGINLSLLLASIVLSKLLNFDFIVTNLQIVISVITTFVAVMIISWVASYKLIRTEPAIALRK